MSDNEYEEDLGDRPLRQGDVFTWTNQARQRPWQTYGLVITADCDLAQEKTRGKLSYIPGFITEDYLWHFWISGKFDKVYESLSKKLTNRINKKLRTIDDKQRDVSIIAIIDWISRSGSAGLLSALQITDRGQSEDIIKLINQVLLVKRLIEAVEPDMELLRRAYAIKNNTDSSNANRILFEEFQGSLGSLPGDVFLLPRIDASKRHGIFFMLRHITQCQISDITIRPDDVRFGSAQAYRLGRVSATYKYAIMQNIAKVFTDIGLPENYKSNCKDSAVTFFTPEA